MLDILKTDLKVSTLKEKMLKERENKIQEAEELALKVQQNVMKETNEEISLLNKEYDVKFEKLLSQHQINMDLAKKEVLDLSQKKIDKCLDELVKRVIEL